MTATTYERVTYKPDGERSRSIFLRDVTEGPLLLSGIEVGRDGSQSGTLAVSKRLHMIDKGLVSARVPYRLNLHYGELEPVA